MSQQDNDIHIKAMITQYQRQHPFVEKPEHKDEQDRDTEQYYQDIHAYMEGLNRCVQEQARKKEITTHIYDNRHEPDMPLHITLEGKGGYWYALAHMNNEDLYVEPHMLTALTGRELRESYNRMEARYAADGTYTPKYSYGPGPFTSEVHADW